MLLTHLIQRRGKGGWVLAIPLIVGVVFATLHDELNLSDKYFTPVILLISAIIIWLIDAVSNAKATDQNKRIKNTFMWLGMKYWAVALAITGTGLFIYLS